MQNSLKEKKRKKYAEVAGHRKKWKRMTVMLTKKGKIKL